MEINQLASGSKGNAILVGDGFSRLLLDCGISYNEIARHVMPSGLAAVLLTHAHGDHSKAAGEFIRRGSHVCLGRETAETIGADKNSNVRIVHHLEQFRANSWVVLPFKAVHDVETFGFLFQSRQTGQKGMYLVDSGYIEYNFPSVSHYLIECNYSDDLLEASDYNPRLKDRIRRNHFSLENLKTFLRTSDLSKTKEIWLLHLSSSNSDEQRFKDEIQQLTGIPVYTIGDSVSQTQKHPA